MLRRQNSSGGSKRLRRQNSHESDPSVNSCFHGSAHVHPNPAAPAEEGSHAVTADETVTFGQWAARGAAAEDGIERVNHYVRAIEIAANDLTISKQELARAWDGLACSAVVQDNGGTKVAGEWAARQQMYLTAVTLCVQKDMAWWWCALSFSVAEEDQIEFQGAEYSRIQCYAYALDAEPDCSRVWLNMGIELEMADDSEDEDDSDLDDDVQGREYAALLAVRDELDHSLEIECYLRALQHDSTNANGWINLGITGGAKIGSVEYGEAECYIKGLECNKNNSDGWVYLAEEGGGVVQGKTYTEQACAEMCLFLNPKNCDAWRALSEKNGGTVGGEHMSADECLSMFWCTADDEDAEDELFLRDDECADVEGHVLMTPAGRFIEAIQIDANNALAWRSLGKNGGGTFINPLHQLQARNPKTTYSKKDCIRYADMLTWT